MIKRISSLLWLRLHIIYSNKSILVQVLLPFIFTFGYKNIFSMSNKLTDADLMSLLSLCLIFSLIIAVGNPISIMISEEKEKNTLRTLLNSGIKRYEYVVSNIIFPIVLSVITIFFTPLILDIDISKNMLAYVFTTLLTSFAIISIYLFIGLVSPSQVSAQIISLPVMMSTLILPMLSGINKTAHEIASISFMSLLIKLLNSWNSFNFYHSYKEFLVVVVWILALIILNSIALKKNKLK